MICIKSREDKSLERHTKPNRHRLGLGIGAREGRDRRWFVGGPARQPSPARAGRYAPV